MVHRVKRQIAKTLAGQITLAGIERRDYQALLARAQPVDCALATTAVKAPERRCS
jgi:hypothetical protein